MPFRWLLLAACASALFASVGMACGGDDDDPSGDPTATITARNLNVTPSADFSKEPTLTMPADRYTLLIDDLGGGYLTDLQKTYELDIASYGGSPSAFSSPEEGKRLLTEWGYLGGFETAYEPEGRVQSVLTGSYYIAIETHLFKDTKGAKEAYAYFESRLKGTKSRPVSTGRIGNQSSAWTASSGSVAGSSVPDAFHRFLFRRGNMVTVVQTWGAQSLMTVDMARGLSAIVDLKALDQREAPRPTPIGGNP